MDEEDLQELKDSRNLVDTTDEMDLMGGTKAELQQRGAEESEREYACSVIVKVSAGSLTFTPKLSFNDLGSRNVTWTQRFRWCTYSQEDGVAYGARHRASGNFASTKAAGSSSIQWSRSLFVRC